MNDAFALSGRASSLHHPQGVALGYELLPLQGEALNTEARSHGEYILKFSEDTESFFRTPWLCPAFFSASPFPLSRISLCPAISLCLVLSLCPVWLTSG